MKSITPYIFSPKLLYSKIVQNKIETALQSNSNSLRKEATMLYLYKKLKPQPTGGTNPKEIDNCSCMWSESKPTLSLSESDLSLTE